MGNAVKVSFSAVTHAGTSYTVNNDRIYANGRFIHPSAADYAQVSLEMVDTRFFLPCPEIWRMMNLVFPLSAI